MAKVNGISIASDIGFEVKSLEQGSTTVTLALTIPDLLPADIGVLNQPEVRETLKGIVEALNSLLKAEQFLKGEVPKAVEIKQDGSQPLAIITNGTGNNINDTLQTFNGLQDKQVMQAVYLGRLIFLRY